MRKLLLFLFFQCFVLLTWANHLVGGELYYAFKGMSANNNPVYKVTLRFFRNMNANVPSIGNEPVYIGIYQNQANLINSITLRFEKADTIKSISFPSCVNLSLQTVYEVGYFSADVELPLNASDYTLAWIRCCRTNQVDNMNLNDGGITLTTVIPGTHLINNQPNNSAVFQLRDTVLICNGQFFNLDFGAADPDNDSLTYQFYPALHGASINDPSPEPASAITINPLPYKTPAFSAGAPMGTNVKLDSLTGRISGIAPAAGTYLVTVRVFEWRRGQLIIQHSKDILIKVKNCSYSAVQLKPEYLYCDSTFTFKNELQVNPGDTWFWDFGVAGISSDTSDLPNPHYNYLQPGIYNVTLIVNKDKPCPAKATTQVKAYPGLKSDFIVEDNCLKSDVQFTDSSSYSGGVINQWTWDFGEPSSSANISNLKNPAHSYTTSGVKVVRLITGTDKGCTDTVYHELNIFPLPLLPLLPDRISICKGDTVQLQSGGSGSFMWTPQSNISSSISGQPFVFPTVSTTYVVTLSDSKCSNKDSVTVEVLPRDPVKIQRVASICEGDTLELKAKTNASVMQWTPTDYLKGGNSSTPLVFPALTGWYKVVANPGMCQTSDSVEIIVLSRPRVYAGNDLVIKEGKPVQLNATGADIYQWWPPAGLSNSFIYNPIVTIPLGIDSVTYVVTGKLSNGCEDADSVTIHVDVFPFVDAPTAFTPNADGLNDVFMPVVKGPYQLLEFAVFNRWGQLVFQTKQPGKGWDGYLGNTVYATGAYVWVVQARNKNNNEVMYKKGTVVLIK